MYIKILKLFHSTTGNYYWNYEKLGFSVQKRALLTLGLLSLDDIALSKNSQ